MRRGRLCARARCQREERGDTFAARAPGDHALARAALIDAEVGNVLCRHVLAGRLADDEARMALRAAGAFVALRYPHVGTLGESAWALRHKLSFYDALYAALAAELGMPLLTAEARLTKTPDLPCTVELV